MEYVQSSRADFEWWLSNMSATLESFLIGQPDEIRTKLDFGVASLDSVEAMILRLYSDADSMLKPEQGRAVNAIACYIGETFRKVVGGRWDIRLDDPKFAFAGLPILVGGRNQSVPRCPLTLATATADRRTGTFLRTVIENATGT